jgi:hypothetical protein
VGGKWFNSTIPYQLLIRTNIKFSHKGENKMEKEKDTKGSGDNKSEAAENIGKGDCPCCICGEVECRLPENEWTDD